MRHTLFTDLDGPILEVSDRYYTIHSDLCEECGLTGLDKNAYWEAKRSAIPEREILGLQNDSTAYQQYHKLRSGRIESGNYLRLDQIQLGVSEWLRHANQQIDLVVVTLRTHSERAMEQLQNLTTLDYFQKVICVGGQTAAAPAEAKAEAITTYLKRHPSTTPLGMVGDSEADLKAAHLCELPSIAVLNGIRNQLRLQEQAPTHTLESLSELQIDTLIASK